VLAIFIGYEVPAGDGKPASFRSAGTHELPLPHSMVVNAAGRRFGDEAFFHKVLNALRDFDVPTHRFTNLPRYFVFSGAFVEKYGFGGAGAGKVPAPQRRRYVIRSRSADSALWLELMFARCALPPARQRSPSHTPFRQGPGDRTAIP
jgi:hypothetical protein